MSQKRRFYRFISTNTWQLAFIFGTFYDNTKLLCLKYKHKLDISKRENWLYKQRTKLIAMLSSISATAELNIISNMSLFYKKNLSLAVISNKTIAKLFTLLLFGVLMTPSVFGQVQGKVYRDFNANGVFDSTASYKEVGLTAITVTAYNSANTVVGTTTTNATGNYTIPSVSGALRVEFSLPTYYFASKGNTGNTSIQFVTAPIVTTNLAVNVPSDYCESTNPLLATPCYINGDGNASGTAASGSAFVGFPYNSTGTTTPTNMYATANLIGSTWGVAYQRSTQTLFTAAFLKRHVGMGPLGIGGIYKVNATSTTPAAVNFVDVKTIGIDVGTITSNTTRGLTANSEDPSHDGAAIFDQVGKVGMGDMDITDDNKKLFLINLNDRKLYSLLIDSDNNTATAPTSADVQSYTIPDPGCTNGVACPWAIKIYQGKVYVGVICTAENTGGTVNNMFAYVYSLDMSTGIFNTTPVYSFPLNYPKLTVEAADGGAWESWTSDQLAFAFTDEGSNFRVIRPQPILSDIAFDVDGSMILTFIDRTGHQYGFRNYSPDPADAHLYNAEIGGDILRVANVSGTFQLENNGTAGSVTGANVGNNGGPGTLSGSAYTAPYGEFYDDATAATIHNDCTQGGSVLLPGSGQVVTCNMDPIQWTSGGIMTYSNVTGQQVNGYELYASNSNVATFGKANGLGDLELLCAAQPLEIGNRVWYDANSNGKQDANEAGIGGLTIGLYADFDNNGVPDVTPAGSACTSATPFGTATAASCGGIVAWTNPSNALTTNATNATAALTSANNTTHCLQLTNLGLSVPSNATITGITVNILRAGGTASATVKDQSIQLIKGGTASGTDKATATTWTTALTTATYGTSSDLWGLTLTPADVNAANFGLNIRAARVTGSPTAKVDYAEIIVCYSTPSSSGPIATITTATTGAIGSYYFNASNVTDGDPSVSGNQAGLAFGKRYLMCLDTTQGPLSTYNMATANIGSNGSDLIDNDATASGVYAQISYLTGAPGQNDHSLDFGFKTPTCNITATLTQGSCQNNNTTAITTDDYFSVVASAVSATNGGASGKYEVILNGTTVLNVGGTAYGTSVTVGGAGVFSSNGATTYQLKVRDLDITSCETTIFTTTAAAACSTIPCPAQICMPVTVVRNN